MPGVAIHDLGTLGLIEDKEPHTLPPEAWSNSRNIRFADGECHTFGGHAAVFGSPSVNPYWLLPVQAASAYYWMYAGAAKVYIYDGTTHTDITRASGGDYSATADDTWNGGLLGGIPILNNGVDVPQYWTGLTTSDDLADLSNWPASTTVKVLRPFKNFLIGLDWTESGTHSPHKVRWSTDADPGSLPSTWSISDATANAGELELSDTGAGFLVDQLPLRDLNIIYKENSTWGMQLIGGQFVFRVFKILERSGLLTQHCVSLIGNGQEHFLHTGEDLIRFDGQNVTKIVEGRMAKWLRSNISSTSFKRCFTVQYTHQDEMWFCFPEEGEDWPNLALVWNWTTNTAAVKEISSIAYMTTGKIFESLASGTTWTSISGTWDDQEGEWNALSHRQHEERLLGASFADDALYFEDNETLGTYKGAAPVKYLERIGLAVVGRDRRGAWKVDFRAQKTVTRIYPKVKGGPVTVRLGSQETKDGIITWQSAQSFDPSTQEYLDFFFTAKFVAVRFESNTNVSWEVEGYDLELTVSAEI